ncbi:MAG: Mrp/NBP35 family ATP-binding protein, partial [Clostridiales bacterium]|nr:Mrp/NBP35 family ATP-binding protein [Clostridiales bacterium]
MASSCDGCASAGNCSAQENGGCGEQQSLLEELNAYSSVKKVIGVVSGKGGVGKSFVTASLATAMKKKGYAVGILDADFTG